MNLRLTTNKTTKSRRTSNSKLFHAAWPKARTTPTRPSQIKAVNHDEFAKSCSEWHMHAALASGEHSIEDMEVDLDTGDDVTKMEKLSPQGASSTTQAIDDNTQMSSKGAVENASPESSATIQTSRRSTRNQKVIKTPAITAPPKEMTSNQNSLMSTKKMASQALFIIIHVNKVAIGSLTGRATSPVKVFADKFMIQLENDATKKDLSVRIPCKYIVSLQVSLFEKPFQIKFTAKEIQFINGMPCSRRSKGGQESESVTLHLAYEDSVPKEVIDDLKELFQVRLAEQNLWPNEQDEKTQKVEKNEKEKKSKNNKSDKIKDKSNKAKDENKEEKKEEKTSSLQQARQTTNAVPLSVRKRTSVKSNKSEKEREESGSIDPAVCQAKFARRTNFEMPDVVEERIKTLEHEAAHYQMLSAQQRMIIQSLESDIRQKTLEIEQYLKEVQRKTEIIDKTQSDEADLESQLKEERDLVKNLDDQLESIRNELLEKDRLLKESADSLVVRDQTIHQLRATFRRKAVPEKTLEGDKEKTIPLSTMEETRQQLMQMQVSKESLIAELQQTKENLAKKNSDYNTLRIQLQYARSDLSDKSDTVLQLSSNFMNLQEDLVKKNELIQSLTEQLNETRFSSNEVNAIRHELSSTKVQLEQVKAELTESKTQLSDSQQTLTQQQNSLSDWILGRGEITLTEKVIGVGAWGNVKVGKFRGTDVAVKQIHLLILSPHNRRLFEREMGIASRCRHPCLVQFIGATNDEGTPLFVMEMLETDLRSLLSRQALENADCLQLGFDVIRALNYLHLARPVSIIHRDISSSNVLLYHGNKTWRAKLSDYGAANFMRLSMTRHPGALLYAAPEASTMDQTTKLDVYSFGVLFCEMCTRELPVPENRLEQVATVTNSDYRRLINNCLRSDISTRLDSKDVLLVFERWIQDLNRLEN